jgi:hypothetical protein
MVAKDSQQSIMKRLIRIVLFFLGACLVAFLLAIATYRIPNGNSQRFEAEIQYQMLDLGQLDVFRYNCIEYVLQNRRVFLRTHSDSVEWFYVSPDDFLKCWPETPVELKRKHYTIKAQFEARPLWLVQGFTIATVIDTQHISGEPLITK